MTGGRITARQVVTPGGVLTDTAVTFEDGHITGVAPAAGPVDDVVLAPGLVDLQVNGIDDIDVATADGPDWDRLDELLLDQGVTTWCPTLVTAPLDRYERPLARIRAARERHGLRPTIAGAHLEGPFLGGAPGAHRTDWIRPVDPAWLDDLGDEVAMVTLAPETDASITAIERLAARGVLVSLGHTDAPEARIGAAAAAGARLVTHLYNGMPPFHHRDPGPVGAALLDDRLAVSLIADLVHVHPSALALAFRAKPPDRVVLVTDAVAWRSDRLAGADLVFDGQAARRGDGTLAGSALRLDRAVANVVADAGVDLATAVRAASTTPADLLGLPDRGRIETGARADLVALDAETLTTTSVWLAGTQVR